jgi:hypothetical protein
MTLIELMIVVAILGLLAIAVLPNVSNSVESRRAREAVRLVSGFCSRAQAAAIGQQRWAGLLLVPSNSAVTTLRMAAVPEPYEGALLNARLAIQRIPSGVLTGTALPMSSCPVINATPSPAPLELDDMITAADVKAKAGDLIQFGKDQRFYEVVSGGLTGITFRMRNEAGGEIAGFTANNTPWPAETPVTHNFSIFRQPRPFGLPFEIPDNRIIDLSWSGYGPNGINALAGYTRFNPGNLPVAVLFDATGRLRQIIRGSVRVPVSAPVYLLVGAADRVGNAPANLDPNELSLGANWQYSDSWWIVIEPFTGAVRVAQCKPNASSAATVTDSQQFVREAASF